MKKIVEGHPHLKRDEKSNAIINSNASESVKEDAAAEISRLIKENTKILNIDIKPYSNYQIICVFIQQLSNIYKI